MANKDIRSPVETEVTHPELGPEVHLTHGVEDGLAVLAGAHHWVILDGRQVGPFLESSSC